MNNQEQIKHDVKNCNTGQFVRTAELQYLSEQDMINYQKDWFKRVNKNVGELRW